MLTRLQKYMQANPLPMWLYTVSFLSAVYTAIHHFTPLKSPALTFFYTCHVFAQPTVLLMMRSSNEERRQHSFPPQQERVIGWIAASAAVVSVASLSIFLVPRAFGVKFGDNIFTLIVIFGFSSMLAMGMGYASRRTKLGHWGATITAWWLLFIVALALLVTAVRSLR